MPKGCTPKAGQALEGGHWLKNSYSEKVGNRRKEVNRYIEEKEYLEKMGDFDFFLKVFVAILLNMSNSSEKPVENFVNAKNGKSEDFRGKFGDCAQGTSREAWKVLETLAL